MALGGWLDSSIFAVPADRISEAWGGVSQNGHMTADSASSSKVTFLELATYTTIIQDNQS